MELKQLVSGAALLVLASACAEAAVDAGGTGGAPGLGGGTGGGINGGVGGNGVVGGVGGYTAAAAGGALVQGAGGTLVQGVGGTLVQGAGGTLVQGAGGMTATTGSGGATATVEACTGTSFDPMGGFYDIGSLCGYAWTATNGEGEDITPGCGSDPCFEDTTSICASGTIPANDTEADVYTGVMIGLNANKDDKTSWVATGSGLTVTFDDGGATGQVRILLQSGSRDYCADAVSGAALDWSDFSVECWDAGNTEFEEGDEIDAVAVQINGDDAAQTFTDFCITNLEVN